MLPALEEADPARSELQCPLCLGNIHHLLYNIRSDKDYQTLHLHPLVSPSSTIPRAQPNPSTPRHALYGRRPGGGDEATWRERQEDRAIERRAYIYREGLFAKHIASNRYTGFRPFTPQSFVSNSGLKSRVTKFIRRDVRDSFPLSTPLQLTNDFSIHPSTASSLSQRRRHFPNDLRRLHRVPTRPPLHRRDSPAVRFPLGRSGRTFRARSCDFCEISVYELGGIRQVCSVRPAGEVAA